MFILASLGGLLVLALCLVIPVFKPFSYRLHVVCYLFVIGSVGLYAKLGGYQAYQQHLLDLEKRKRAEVMLKTIKSPDDLIKNLKQAVLKRPKNPRGWFLLAKLYLAKGNYKEAEKAFAKAYQLNKKDFKTAFFYMETLYVNAKEAKSVAVEAMISQLQKLNANSVELKLFLMRDAYMHGDNQQAQKIAQDLLAKLEQGSKLYSDVQSLILEIEKHHRGEKHG